MTVISLLSSLTSPTTDDLTAATTQLVISLILKTYETKTRGKKLSDFISRTIDSKSTCYVCSQACFGNPNHHWCTSSLTSRGSSKRWLHHFQSLTVISLLSSLRLPTTDDFNCCPHTAGNLIDLEDIRNENQGKKTGDFISRFTIDSKLTCYVCSQACFGNTLSD